MHYKIYALPLYALWEYRLYALWSREVQWLEGACCGIGMEGERGSRSVSKNLSTRERGSPSASMTGSMRVSRSVRETRGEVGVGWIHCGILLLLELIVTSTRFPSLFSFLTRWGHKRGCEYGKCAVLFSAPPIPAGILSFLWNSRGIGLKSSRIRLKNLYTNTYVGRFNSCSWIVTKSGRCTWPCDLDHIS